jgi:SAM-dependent methyltransferase
MMKTRFVPGSNLSGDLACADWRFLLPDFRADNVVCLGVPSANNLTVLRRMARRVWVVSSSLAELRELRRASEEKNAGQFQLIHAKDFTALPFPDGAMDLIWMKDSVAVSAFLRRNGVTAELARVLRPDGVVYYEVSRPLDVLRARRLTGYLARHGLSSGSSFWLAPLKGEAHTAVPVGDRPISRFFFSRVLYGQSPRSQKLSRLGETLSRVGLLPYLVWRRGLLIRRSPAESHATEPPAYLVAASAAAGHDFKGFRFGLSAHGRHNSNKVIFYLFHSSHRTPDVVVKMTRTPEFNYRLERERHVLTALKEKNFVPPGTYPDVLFLEFCGDLALLAERAVEGHPFRRRTQAHAACPLARAAVAWMTQLGKASAREKRPTPAEVARVLEEVLAKFAEIYGPSRDERAFLERQIGILRNATSPLPAVFLHGDASVWNILATRENGVVFLDWEAAEPRGVPLWDLFYFFYTFGCWISRKKGQRDKVASFREHFLKASPLNAFIQEAAANYCREVGLEPKLMEPLFYTCWIHRALRQSILLPPERLQEGEAFRVLRESIRRHDAPGLSAIFGHAGRGAEERGVRLRATT